MGDVLRYISDSSSAKNRSLSLYYGIFPVLTRQKSIELKIAHHGCDVIVPICSDSCHVPVEEFERWECLSGEGLSVNKFTHFTMILFYYTQLISHMSQIVGEVFVHLDYFRILKDLGRFSSWIMSSKTKFFFGRLGDHRVLCAAQHVTKTVFRDTNNSLRGTRNVFRDTKTVLRDTNNYLKFVIVQNHRHSFVLHHVKVNYSCTSYEMN